MKLNQQLLQINRSFLVCFIVSASLSAVVAQLLSDYENYLSATFTIIFGYIVYFGIFSSLFYLDSKDRYKTMKSSLIRRELLSLISSFGVGEAIYLGTRWPTLYYFLEIGIEPYLASLVSEIIATTLYMMSVTIFLRKTNLIQEGLRTFAVTNNLKKNKIFSKVCICHIIRENYF